MTEARTPPRRLGLTFDAARAAWESGQTVRFWPLRGHACVPVEGKIRGVASSPPRKRNGRSYPSCHIWIEGKAGFVCGTHVEVVR